MWIEIVVDLKGCLRNFKGRVFQFKADQRRLNSLNESKSNNGENSAIHLLLAEFEVRVFFALNLWPKLEEKAPKIAESQLAY